MSETLEAYSKHITARMKETSGNLVVAEQGNFNKLGCIDSKVQEIYPTDLVLAGALAYWEANERGGAEYLLQQLADLGLDGRMFELHFPCGQLLLEMGLRSWKAQDRFTSELVQRVSEFNRINRTHFQAKVHKYVGTAGDYLK